MEIRFVRLGAAILISAGLFIFFAPLIPYSIPYQCAVPPGGINLGCPPGPPSGFYTGYDSLGLVLLHWGASFDGYLGTYMPPVITLALSGGGGVQSQLTAYGALVLVVVPAVLCVAVLLFPEERRGIRIVRMRLLHRQ